MARNARRVLFVLKHRDAPYGDCRGGYGWGESPDRPLSSGLYNSARFVADMLARAGIPTKVVHVPDGNFIHREIVAFGATDVVIEALWCPPYKFDHLRIACPQVRFIVRNHSDAPFLASEGHALGWWLEYLTKPNVVAAPNSLKMLADTRFLAATRHLDWCEAELKAKVPYLPNYYPVDDRPARPPTDAAHVEVGCFGAIRPLKNHLTQALGALMFARKVGRRLRFNINGGRCEQNGDPIRKALAALFAGQPDAELVCHGWLDHTDFKGLVAAMDVVSAVSFSETFCIVAADAASQSVPLVTSAEVSWASPLSYADPTSAASIAEALHRAWNRRWASAFYDPSREGLRHFSAHARALWLAHFA